MVEKYSLQACQQLVMEAISPNQSKRMKMSWGVSGTWIGRTDGYCSYSWLGCVLLYIHLTTNNMLRSFQYHHRQAKATYKVALVHHNIGEIPWQQQHEAFRKVHSAYTDRLGCSVALSLADHAIIPVVTRIDTLKSKCPTIHSICTPCPVWRLLV